MSAVEIIIVEDEPKIAQLLHDYLQKENYQVTILNEGSRAVEIIKDRNPSMVILDLMLSGKDGLTICKELRHCSDVPIIMLTARVDEIDRLIGLEVGADDYICKPFSPREVVARVRTILRRVNASSQQDHSPSDAQLNYQNIRLYLDRFRCEVSNQTVELTPVEFRLLQALISKPGRVFSRDNLMAISYSDDRIVSDRTIDSHVKNLRKKLSQVLGEGDIIHSIYGVGYKIE